MRPDAPRPQPLSEPTSTQTSPRHRGRASLAAVVRAATARDHAPIMALSRSSNVFSEAELESLAEDLPTCDPEDGDRLMVYHDAAGGGTRGFIQYSPAEITDNSWFVYWIAVAKDMHGQGIGAALLRHAEADIRADGGRVILIETSSTPPYEPTRRFYLGRGYALVAQVPGYYADGDDKCIFLKRL